MLRAGHSEASVPLRSLPGVSSAQSWPVLGLGALGLGWGKRVQERAEGGKGWKGSLGSGCGTPKARLRSPGLQKPLRVSEHGEPRCLDAATSV